MASESVVSPLKAPQGFSLVETARSHGWADVIPFRWDPVACRLHRRDLEGAVTLRQEGPGRLLVEHRPADSGACGRARVLLNLDQSLADFHALCREHPRLGWVPERGAGWFLRGRDAWEDASKAVCFTNIAWRQAASCMNRVADAGIEGCWPAPGELLKRGESWLREHARVGYRAPYILALARGFEEGRFSPEAATAAAFQAMPGIGPSTAKYLAGMRGSWEQISYDSSTSWLLRSEYGIAEPCLEDADRIFSPFGDFRGLACLLDLHESVRRCG
ncbi:MAG: hypothetical protein VX498_11740 [Myxococcota bacterium]|nr:hypothetical protein [Myxococcota bacterium]